MSAIVLIDTSVLLNILNVPGYSQDKATIDNQYKLHIENRDRLLLPMATILETGSHIADIRNGRQRRNWGEIFVSLVKQTQRGEAPWSPLPFPDLECILTWIDEFPDFVSRGIAVGGGQINQSKAAGFADLTIIKDWEKQRELHSMTRVMIWSLDNGLQGYDTGMP